MKKPLILLLCLASMPAMSQDARRLAALSQIESGDNDRAVGKAGEVSRYQIMPGVWRAYSRSRQYQDAIVARRVACAHISYLERYWPVTQRPMTNIDLYILWCTRHGYYARHGFDPKSVAKRIRERAQRFANLVDQK